MKNLLGLFIILMTYQLSYCTPSDTLLISCPTAGQLYDSITISEINTAKVLTISGKINAADIHYISANMTHLTKLDLLNCNIEEAEGEIYANDPYYGYPANEFPKGGFKNKLLDNIIFPARMISIGEEAFSGSGLTGELTIPSSVETIGNMAFKGCLKISSLTLNRGVKTIKTDAFYGCNKITGELNLPDGLEWIGDDAFYGCYRLTGILTLPESLKYLGTGAFISCTGLTGKIVIPSTIDSLGTSIFSFCKFTEAEINTKEVSNGMFANCGQLIKATLSNSVTSIGNTAFTDCGLLATINFPTSLDSIGNEAFVNCTSLPDSIALPEGLLKIKHSAFLYCNTIKTVVFPSTLQAIENNVFQECTSLEGRIDFPDKISLISYEAFYGCTKLTQLKLPNNNAKIDFRAFYGCSGIKAIHIPTSITSIATMAFSGCTSVDTIYCDAMIPPVLEANVLEGISRTNCKLLVPPTSISAYAEAPQWSEFGGNIVTNVVPDTKRPFLLTIYPSADLTNVSTATSICLTLNEKVVTASKAFSMGIYQNETLKYLINSTDRVATDSTMFYIDPSTIALEPNTLYALKIGANSLTDLAGNGFPESELVVRFTTGERNETISVSFDTDKVETVETESIGYEKQTICLNDLQGNIYYYYNFFSRYLLKENQIPFYLYKNNSNCLAEIPNPFTTSAYSPTTTNALTLENSEYYDDIYTKATIDLTGFDNGIQIDDIKLKIYVEDYYYIYLKPTSITLFSDGAPSQTFSLYTTQDAFNTFETNYNVIQKYRNIHFAVPADVKADSIVVNLNGSKKALLLNLDISYKTSSKPVVDLGEDRSVCSINQEILDAGYTPNATYLWSTGDTSRTITIGGTGSYSVIVKNALGTTYDTVYIKSYPTPESPFNNQTITMCKGENLLLEAGKNKTFDYLWNDNSTESSLNVERAGNYWVTITNGICTITDTARVVETSGATAHFIFTPCCISGYDDIIGELYRLDDNNQYALFESNYMPESTTFDSIPIGEYLFKAHFVSYSYPQTSNFLDTYQNGAPIWSEATPIHLECPMDTTIIFELAKRDTSYQFTGSGSISGTINTINNLRSTQLNTIDCSLKVNLLNSSNSIIATVCPATDGTFSFNNLVDGNYSISFEQIGFTQRDAYQVTLTNGETITEVNFEIDALNMVIKEAQNVGINELSRGNDVIRISPNPISDKSVVTCNLNSTKTIELLLLDITGKKLKVLESSTIKSGKNEIIIDLSNYSGVYFICLKSVDGCSYKQIIVN